MLTLFIRTDKPESEIYLYKDDKKIAYSKWQAHRQLAETIHKKIDEVIEETNIDLIDIRKVVVYGGPGSFTGLRIGVSVANAIGYSQKIPTIAVTGEDWVENGLVVSPAEFSPVAIEYGSDPFITEQKK